MHANQRAPGDIPSHNSLIEMENLWDNIFFHFDFEWRNLHLFSCDDVQMKQVKKN